jgi:deazaflavin-dependent oxidoreductase (nitroreductase family)
MSNPSDQEHRGRSRPTGALRLAFRLPIYLYRLGLGQLLGHRFMLLTHLGRRTGRVYQTALEVVRYDPSLRETVVASGWGERSDWYRNQKAHPALEIRTGRERYAPEQRFLTPEGVYREIVDYERRHPCGSSPLCWASGSTAPTRRVGSSPIPCGWWPSDLGRDHRAVGASPWRPTAGKREHGVTGIFGLREKDAGLLVRFAYRFSRRIFGKVPEPVGVTAHHRRDSEEGRLPGMEVHE